MKLIKPKFWLKKNFISYSLYSFSIVTYLINLYKKLILKKKFSIKTICIGNIYVGGTGKTLLTVEIHNILSKKFKTVFIKKNYKNQKDEINLLRKRGKIIAIKNREIALSIAEKKNLK